MNIDQKKYWNILEFIDEAGRGLDRDEIDFVADLIDNNHRGKLEPDQCAEIRRLLLRRAGGWSAFNAHRDNIIVQRTAQE